MTNKPIIIGLCGYAGSGKDTVRFMLEEVGFNGIAFADSIRAMLRELLVSNRISDTYINSREFKEAVIPELGVSYRQLAQTLGTEWGRSVHPDFWIKLVANYIHDVAEIEPTPHFCISDVRFPNEAQWIKDHGGVIWRIERPAAVPVRAHVSESEIYHFTPDLVIDNSGSIDDLRVAVAEALGEME
jgi:hypothetical protein